MFSMTHDLKVMKYFCPVTNRSRSYQTFFFFIFQFSLLSLALALKIHFFSYVPKTQAYI
jgi:hypothetical protein